MNAAATSTAATSVGTVLRSSKLARFDRRLPQVYTHVKGNWGAVKAPLPAPGKLPATYLTFRALDTAFRVPDLRVADHKVQAVQHLIEQVAYVVPAKGDAVYGKPKVGPSSNTGKLADGSMPVNLAEMSNKEFRKWLQTVDPSKMPASHVQIYKEVLRAHISPKSNHQNEGMDDTVAGPVYSKWEVPNTHIHVHGRVLRQYSNVQSVGVSGFVFKNEVGSNSKAAQPSRALAEYQVDHLYWDRRGRPHGQVSPVGKSTDNVGHGQRPYRSRDAVERRVQLTPAARQKVSEMVRDLKY